MENNMKTIDIDRIYKHYGYKVNIQNNVRIYKIDQGMYQGIEILYKESLKNQIDDLKKQFNDLGYAVQVRKYKNIDEIEKTLFGGFFQIKIQKNKIKSKYANFAKKQVELFNRKTDKIEVMEDNPFLKAYLKSHMMYMFSQSLLLLQ